jgi:hypothetical protein
MAAIAYIRCDNCGHDVGDYGWRTVAQCRADMRQAGWVTGRRDLCPDCQTER